MTGEDNWEEPPEEKKHKQSIKARRHKEKKSKDIVHTNQLFNLAEDPVEKINLAHIEKDKVLEMRKT